jgi:hypothetical protein
MRTTLSAISAPERPRRHQRKLLSPEGVAVRPDALFHHHIGARVTQRVRPSGCVSRERTAPACRRRSRRVGATSASRQAGGNPRPATRRTLRHRRQDDEAPWQAPARRHTAHSSSVGPAGPRTAHAPNGARPGRRTLVCRETLRIKGKVRRALAGRVLVDPSRLIGDAMGSNDHGGRHTGCLENASPRRDQLAVAGEDDGLRRCRRYVRRDLPSSVVLKLGGNKAHVVDQELSLRDDREPHVRLLPFTFWLTIRSKPCPIRSVGESWSGWLPVRPP